MRKRTRQTPLQRLARLLRFTYDVGTDRVSIHVGAAAAEPALWVRRHDLRSLCDLLHDYADELDRKDRA
ncbi:hypothetical protein KZX28_10165 [Microbacterium sp. EYE_384]|nr:MULTISPECIES: hypothetical protein [unclassified Microbacterium]MCK6080975.1 hypothetical protein [Microbacterium sp. EYE_382]MCK6086245.1 hypothetical protein [Microbacterium sp. EYE_384]MCK6127166.1 hypothetical protein [Microbacterium sp. EYE_79]MCK6141930.1 hypothetical protein [Microbacterium sp. EYE_39]MCK6228430.1 hypothetical protein [Microbacterium sp. EYE_77]